MSQRFTAVVVAFLFVGLAVGVASATTYNLTALPALLGDTQTVSFGVSYVNGAPEAVGCSFTGSLTTGSRTPVSWNSAGVPTSLLSAIGNGATAGSGNVAQFIDGSGDIVGQTLVGGVNKAFYLPYGGSGTILPALDGSNYPIAEGCDSSGMVVGYAVAADGNQHAILWSASTGVVDLGTSGTASFATAINPSGTVIVGDTGTVFGQQGEACEWTKSGSTWTMSIICPPTTYAASLANAINSSGAIVGSCYDYPSGGFPSTTRDALYWPTGGAGSIVNLGQMGDTSAIATGINDSGVIVGYDSTIPFVDYNGTAAGMTNVTTLLAAGQGTGWTLQYCYGIDANGDIAARARYSGAYEAALLTPVPTPEPSTLLLAVGGLAGLLVCAWRKRK